MKNYKVYIQRLQEDKETNNRMQTDKQIVYFTRFIWVTLATLREPGDNTLDELNRMILYLKGCWILSYYLCSQELQQRDRNLPKWGATKKNPSTQVR